MEDSKLVKSYRIPLFYLVTMAFWFSMYTYVPIFGVYIEKLGSSHKMAGLIIGSYGFVQMLLRIPIGIASDKIHKRKLFINFGLCFTFFSAAGLWIFKDLTAILIFRSLAGAAAATWVDFTILYTSYYKPEESTKAIGIISFFNSMAQMLAMLMGGWFAQNISNGSTFLLGMVAGLVGLAASLFLVENYKQSARKFDFKEVLNVIRDRTLITVSLLAIISQLLTFSTTFGFTPVFAEIMGASKFDLGLLSVFSSLPNAIASLIAGTYLSQKLGERKMVVTGFLLMGVFTISIPFTGNIWMLIITQALAGLGRGFSFPLLMGLSIKHMEPDRRATAMGFFQSIYGLGMFMGPVATGMISDAMSLTEGFIFIGILGCITAALSARVLKRS